jgi:phage/plasmid primase, P4 family, C-terminal domain
MAPAHTKQSRSRSRPGRPGKDADAEIIAALDIRAEYQSLGVRIVAKMPTPSGWLSCRAVGRDDAQPSAAINVQTGRYTDRGTGDNFSLWEFAAQHGHFASWREARDHFAGKAGIEIRGQKSVVSGQKAPPTLKRLPWSDALAQLWTLHKPGVSLGALRAFGAEQAEYRGRRVIAIPGFGAAGPHAEPTGWVLWDVTGRPLPVQGGSAKMKNLEGSQPGLIGREALDRLFAAEQRLADVTLWKVEGPTDALALWSALPAAERTRHLILTNNAGTSQHPFPWLWDLVSRVARVVVVHDCDRDGQSGGQRWAEACAAHAETRHLTLPFELADKHGRDLRDFLAEHAWGELLELAEAAPLVAAGDDRMTGSREISAAAAQDVGFQEPEGADTDPHRLAGVFLRKSGFLHADGLALRYWREQWYAWTGRAFRHLPDADLRARVTACLKEEFDRCFVEAQANGEEVDAPQPVTRMKVADTLQALTSLCLLPSAIDPPCWLGEPPLGWGSDARELLCTASGILHLGRAVEDLPDAIAPLTPRFWTLNSVDYPYSPAAGLPDRWIDFLCGQWHHEECRDPESINLLQEWFGYCLTPDTRHEKILMLVGPKRSGKGTIADVLSALIGEENVCAPTLSGLCDRFALQGLFGRTLAVIDDARLSNRTDTAVIVERMLSISGGARQTIDRKHTDPLQVRLPIRFAILTNELPNLRDASGAMASRFLIVQTTKSFFGVEDKGLKAALQHPEVLTGILNWAIEGYARLRARGAFVQPESSQQAIDELEELTSPVRAFVNACCVLQRDAAVERKELFAAYVAWCKGEERPPQARAMFGRDLKSAFPQVKDTQTRNGAASIRWYGGIRLADLRIESPGESNAKNF